MAKSLEENQEVVDPAEKEDNEAPNNVRYSISSYGADYPVDGLIKRLRAEDILIPDFQRKFVWDLPKASRFIESLLLGLPVPGIFLSKDPDTQRLFIIDGQQRLKSLLYFYDGIFEGKEFKLHGIAKAFEGKGYKTLDDEDRRRLDDQIIHATIVRQEVPEDDHSGIHSVFERLNTGGMLLSPQEIRACVDNGPLNDLLWKLNQDKAWRTIYGPESSRLKDQEIILRFFALHEELNKYERPMKTFLNAFMKRHRHLKRGLTAKALIKLFLEPVKVANEYLGPALFRPERSLNLSLLESVLLATAARLKSGKKILQGPYVAAVKGLLADPKFMDLCGVGTTHEDRLKKRLEMAKKAIASAK